MKIDFFKYQGTGNDFVLIDNREERFPRRDGELVSKLCDRHFGIGADGLILLEKSQDSDFSMVYFNSNGLEGSMCGNGARCTVAFAKFLGIIENATSFHASDGLHHADIIDNLVRLNMMDVEMLKRKEEYTFLDTGSPHHVQLVDNLEHFDVVKEGKRLRYGLYGQNGSNINFVQQIMDDKFAVRTYERGVEDETLSCGTGVTAVALAMYDRGLVKNNEVKVSTTGGDLSVCFDKKENGYRGIYLTGPAEMVFQGSVSW